MGHRLECRRRAEAHTGQVPLPQEVPARTELAEAEDIAVGGADKPAAGHIVLVDTVVQQLTVEDRCCWLTGQAHPWELITNPNVWERNGPFAK